MLCKRLPKRQLQLQIGLLGQALRTARQPTRLHGHRYRVGMGGQGVDLHRCRQQHSAVIAQVHQIPYRKTLGRGPMHVAGRPAWRQLPLHMGCHACLAGVFPIGMPAGGVFQLHAQPHRLTRGNALRRPSQQPRGNFCRAHFCRRHLPRQGRLRPRSACASKAEQQNAYVLEDAIHPAVSGLHIIFPDKWRRSKGKCHKNISFHPHTLQTAWAMADSLYDYATPDDDGLVAWAG